MDPPLDSALSPDVPPSPSTSPLSRIPVLVAPSASSSSSSPPPTPPPPSPPRPSPPPPSTPPTSPSPTSPASPSAPPRPLSTSEAASSSHDEGTVARDDELRILARLSVHRERLNAHRQRSRRLHQNAQTVAHLAGSSIVGGADAPHMLRVGDLLRQVQTLVLTQFVSVTLDWAAVPDANETALRQLLNAYGLHMQPVALGGSSVASRVSRVKGVHASSSQDAGPSASSTPAKGESDEKDKSTGRGRPPATDPGGAMAPVPGSTRHITQLSSPAWSVAAYESCGISGARGPLRP